MKNIWKLLLVALMAIAMVGCPVDKDDEDSEEVKPGKFVAGEGLYAAKADKSAIGGKYGVWGGFGILLAKTAPTGNFNPQASALKEPTYQLKLNSINNTFSKYPSAVGNSKVKQGDKVQASAAAIVTLTDFTLVIDMAKIEKEAIYVLAGGAEKGADAWMKAGRDVDLTGYKPYVIALFDATTDVGEFTYATHCSWDAEIYGVPATTTVTFPTTWGTFLDEPDVSAINETTIAQPGACFVIKGSSAGIENLVIPFVSGEATADLEITKFDAWGPDKDYFAFWFTFQAGDDTNLVKMDKKMGAGPTTLGVATGITPEKTDNFEAKDLKETGTYTITIDAKVEPATITIVKKN